MTLYGTLGIRADANRQIGLGHVMRCIALAQAWCQHGGKVVLFSENLPESLCQRCIAENIAISGEVYVTDFLVVDGYHFTPAYLVALKQNGQKLLVVDDVADSDLSAADLILNHNPYADAAMYPGLIALTGARYTLMRREFRHARSVHVFAHRILLTMGGADPDNQTLAIMRCLQNLRIPRLNIQIIVGAVNSHLASLQQALHLLRHHQNATLHCDPDDLPQRMASCDLAITAAGSTCWELAGLGVPMLFVVTATNQQGVAKFLLEQQAALPFDETALQYLLTDGSARRKLAAAGQRLIDGRGADRVAVRIACFPLSLRRATLADAKTLLDWANDPQTRHASFQAASVPWETHMAWLERRLADSNFAFFIAEAHSRAVGTIRFERDSENCGEISLSIAPGARGSGLAAKLIALGIHTVLDEGFCRSARGWVKAANAASLRAFQRSGCIEGRHELHHGVESVEFTATLDTFGQTSE
jgi:UDP-2,4-diacetamido-2,4,6-trideoxy-beta-L-altropyranose hydrolase